MIRLLLALHPKRWRDRYGEEYQALLEAGPLRPRIVVDVLRNAAGLHARAHAGGLRVTAALGLSAIVEVFAVRADLTDNILWAPTTPARALALVAVVVPWAPVAAAVRKRKPTVL